MSRNVSILIIILVIVVVAGYLVWLRGRFQAPKEEITPTPAQQVIEPSPSVTQAVATPSATTSPTTTPSSKRSATGSAKTTR